MTGALWVRMPIIQNIVMGTGCNPGEIDIIARRAALPVSS